MTNRKKTILLVEDESDLNKALTTGLNLGGFNVITAKDGQEGMKYLKTDAVDLVLLDIIMPFFDGVWFIREMKQDASYKNLPVIVLTNLTHGEKVTDAMSMGVQKVLIKTDTSIDQLIDAIKETLKS